MIEAELPDGTILEFPEGTSTEVMQRVVKQNLAQVSAKTEEKGFLSSIGAGLGQGVGNVALGAQNLIGMGLEKIGANGAGRWLQNDAAMGKQKLASEAAPYSEQNPIATGGGKLAGEVISTIPVGGILAKGVGAASNAVGLSSKAAPLINALRTGGFSSGGVGGAKGLATRAAGGATVSGASTSIIDQEQAALGATLGAAFPVAAVGAGKAGVALGKALRPEEQKIALKIAEQLNITPESLEKSIKSAEIPEIAGYRPTLPQAMGSPELSQLQRSLKTVGSNAIGDAERLQQQQFFDVLDSVAPTAASPIDAAQRVGGAIEAFARLEHDNSKKLITKAFENIDPNGESRLYLPVSRMEEAKNQFLGKGTFGSGEAANKAIAEAKKIGNYSESFDPVSRQNRVYSQGTPFGVIQNLRSSLLEEARKASEKGSIRSAAALNKMASEIDSELGKVSFSSEKGNEFFPIEMVDRYRDALNLKKDAVKRFETGPQSTIFRQGGDGQAAIQGAEIPSRFYSSKLSQVDDIKAFKKLVNNDVNLINELKSFAVTDGAFKSNSQGELGNQFIKWARSRSGANQELFTKQEADKINAVAKAVERQIRTEGLGRVSGSDTAQKLANIQSNGVLDSPFVNMLANRVPFIGQFTGPMLNSLRNNASQGRNKTTAELLADPYLFLQEIRRPIGPEQTKNSKAIAQALRGAQLAAPAIVSE